MSSTIRILALVALLGACTTPSIPIPPPESTKIGFEHDDTSGTATFSYAGDPDFGGAVVYVFDRNTGKGVIDTARADGSVGPTAPFMADLGDQVLVTFDLGDQLASICVLLVDGTPSAECES